jgi:hypothetical protein
VSVAIASSAKVLSVHFADRSGAEKFKLRFRLRRNRFVSKWLKLLRQAVSRRLPVLDGGVFYGAAMTDADKLLKAMNDSIRLINAHGRRKIKLKPRRGIDQSFLNELHDQFETLSLLPSYSPEIAPPTVVQALIELNASIHKYEVFTRPIEDRFARHFGIDVCFDGQDKVDLEREDYPLFTPDRVYGGLYLNYATVGVPVLEAYRNRLEERPVPQTQYKADFTLDFSDFRFFDEWDALNDWIATRYGLDPLDKRLAIGSIPLGELVDEGLSRDEIFENVHRLRRVTRVSLR